MKDKRILIVFIILVLGFYVIVISSQGVTSVSLTKGKNYVNLNLSEPIYVKTLIKLNPDIEAISYEENNQTIGYVNVFGGIGEDFIVENRDYEIIAGKNLTLIIPS